MPHELSMTDDQAEMMYVGETPWHGLGTRLDNPATAVEAIRAAHLDWTVAATPVVMSRHGHYYDIDGYQAIHRTDTGEVFGVMTDRYEIVQNENAWTFMDSVLGPGKAHYHTAGALRDGRVVWILAKLDGTAEIVTGDPVEKYLLLVTSHDGSLALQIHTTPVRVVCGNTMTAALARGRQYISIKHTSSVHRRIEEAQKALAKGEAYFDDMVAEARQFSRHPMTDKDMAAFAKALLKIHPQSHKINAQTETAERQINELFITGRGQDNPLVRGTAWAAYNAVTEYIDYRSRVQKVGDVSQGSIQAQDRRLHRSWFGRGQEMRNDAWTLLRNHRLRGARAFETTPPPYLRQHQYADAGGTNARIARV